ncbi:MAG: hypothetical protein EAX89_15420 [Candidatus Lokiarchaeota archaeon]|nr:hypothetical protein [Candidatus Lokiarchaeota archaeon]
MIHIKKTRLTLFFLFLLSIIYINGLGLNSIVITTFRNENMANLTVLPISYFINDVYVIIFSIIILITAILIIIFQIEGGGDGID